MAGRVATHSTLAALLFLSAITASAVMTETKLVDAIHGGDNDHLGNSAAMDGLYAIAGAPWDTVSGTNAGKAVIYFFNGASWIQQADLFPSSNPAEGRFGWSVDIAGDLAVVGAPYHVASGTSTGLAYLFRRSGTSWLPDGVLSPGDGALDDHYGDDVAIHGNTIVVGSPGHATSAGAVYIYVPGATGGWTLEKKFDGPIGPNTGFGGTVDVWGDWMAASSSGSGVTGFVHTHRRISSGWIHHPFVDGSDSNPFDGFGGAIGLWNERLLAGAPHHSHSASYGAGYIKQRNPLDSSWPEKAEFLEVSVGGVQDHLGWSGGLEGNLAAVGAPYGDGIAVDSGLVYAYRMYVDETWHQVAALTAGDGFQHQKFGESSAVSGDCIIVGAPSDDAQGSFAGAAYIYCGVPDLLFLVDIDVICCFKPPDYTTGPVEFEFRFENVTMAPETIRRWVQLIRPDGGIVEVVPPADVEVLEGETHAERFQLPLEETNLLGDYDLVMHWMQGEDEHTEVVRFAMFQALPGLPISGLLVLAALLALVGLHSTRRNSEALRKLRL